MILLKLQNYGCNSRWTAKGNSSESPYFTAYHIMGSVRIPIKRISLAHILY